LGISPDVHAVEIHENGDIAGHANAALRAILPQRAPLLMKGELDGAAHVEVVGQFLAGARQCSRLAAQDVTRPLVPALQVRTGAQRVKQNEILQPPVEAVATKLRAAIANSGIFRAKTCG